MNLLETPQQLDQKQTVMASQGYTLYVAKCPKPESLFCPYFTLEHNVYCTECEDWHDTEEVSDFRVQHHPDNTISVVGYGYYEPTR